MNRTVRRELNRRSIAIPESGLGVPCGEAQADGVPCGELGILCSECEKARAMESDRPPEHEPEVRCGP